MGAARRATGMKRRRSKSRRRVRKSNKRLRPSQRQPSDHDEAAEVEAPERLLLSALKFWEVERDLIDKRMDAIGVRQSNRCGGAAGQSIQRKLVTTGDTALVKGNEHEKSNQRACLL